jgi:hypothetical protein
LYGGNGTDYQFIVIRINVEQISAAVVQQIVCGYQAADWITSALLTLWPFPFSRKDRIPPFQPAKTKILRKYYPRGYLYLYQKNGFFASTSYV